MKSSWLSIKEVPRTIKLRKLASLIRWIKKLTHFGVSELTDETYRRRLVLLNTFYLISSIIFIAATIQSYLCDEARGFTAVFILCALFQVGLIFILKGFSGLNDIQYRDHRLVELESAFIIRYDHRAHAHRSTWPKSCIYEPFFRWHTRYVAVSGIKTARFVVEFC